MTDMDKMMIDEAAELISDYVAWHRWANMAEDRSDLRLKVREGDYDVNEPTKDDCRQAAKAVLTAYNPDDRLREALEGDDECDISEHELEVVLQEAAFVHGAQACREMMARFVENGPPTDPKVLAGSIRANWHPGWGDDPGKLPGSIPYNAFGETEETDALLAALSPLPQGDG